MILDFRTPETGSRAQRWWREWSLWKYYVDYFPITLVKTAELPPDRNYLFGCHPHGILSFGTYASLCTSATGFEQKFPGIKTHLATLNGQFWWPFRREQGLICGAVASSQRSLDYVLGRGQGNAVGVVLGGAEEVLDTHADSFDLNLMKRRGFVKVALRNGASLVPIYNFGENQTYTQLFPNKRGSFNRRFQVLFVAFYGSTELALVTYNDFKLVIRGVQNCFLSGQCKKVNFNFSFQSAVRKIWGFCPPVIYGRGIFNSYIGILPRKTPINTVIGRPIPVERCLEPSKQRIDELHAQYCQALKELFEAHKGAFGIAEHVHLNLY
ncbi:unnamed protein product [Enterobius vermicularis]|uniref:Acyltransferase n=1 Tax=Enterobius vermicularis TaxID=51028 RepID=A0A0N4VMP7_ENTVE|nr:unnamed protein product [Enterobius vermicularis]